eukprot:7641704-Pyramimonas_sp.AAC.1
MWNAAHLSPTRAPIGLDLDTARSGGPARSPPPSQTASVLRAAFNIEGPKKKCTLDYLYFCPATSPAR